MVAVQKRGRFFGRARCRAWRRALTREMGFEAQLLLNPSFPRLKNVDLRTFSGDYYWRGSSQGIRTVVLFVLKTQLYPPAWKRSA